MLNLHINIVHIYIKMINHGLSKILKQYFIDSNLYYSLCANSEIKNYSWLPFIPFDTRNII